MMNPRQELAQDLNAKIELFQSSTGKAQANSIATVSLILNEMAQTIMIQYDEIEKKNLEIANLKLKLEPKQAVGPSTENTTPSAGEPDPVIT